MIISKNISEKMDWAVHHKTRSAALLAVTAMALTVITLAALNPGFLSGAIQQMPNGCIVVPSLGLVLIGAVGGYAAYTIHKSKEKDFQKIAFIENMTAEGFDPDASEIEDPLLTPDTNPLGYPLPSSGFNPSPMTLD